MDNSGQGGEGAVVRPEYCVRRPEQVAGPELGTGSGSQELKWGPLSHSQEKKTGSQGRREAGSVSSLP